MDVLIVKGEVQAACLQYVYNLYALCTACVLSSVWTADGTFSRKHCFRNIQHSVAGSEMYVQLYPRSQNT